MATESSQRFFQVSTHCMAPPLPHLSSPYKTPLPNVIPSEDVILNKPVILPPDAILIPDVILPPRCHSANPTVIPAVFSGNPGEGSRTPTSLTTDAAHTRPRCGGEKTLDSRGRGNDEGGGKERGKIRYRSLQKVRS